MKQLALFPFAVVLALALAGVAQGAAPDGASGLMQSGVG